jgi:acylphosphatase
MKKSYSITIHGHVQGVGFRFHAKAKANEFEIAGFVRNQPDGAVFIEAEGEEEQLEAFVAWCRMGPRWARVDSLDVQSIEARNYRGFSVK